MPFAGERDLTEKERADLIACREQLAISAVLVCVFTLAYLGLLASNGMRSWGHFFFFLAICGIAAVPVWIFGRPFYLVHRALKEGVVREFGPVPPDGETDDGTSNSIRSKLGISRVDLSPILLSRRNDLLFVAGQPNRSVIHRRFGHRVKVAHSPSFDSAWRDLSAAERWELRGRIRTLIWSALAWIVPAVTIFVMSALLYFVGPEFYASLHLVLAIFAFIALVVPTYRIMRTLPRLVRDLRRGEVLKTREGNEYLPCSLAEWVVGGHPAPWRVSSSGKLWALVPVVVRDALGE